MKANACLALGQVSSVEETLLITSGEEASKASCVRRARVGINV